MIYVFRIFWADLKWWLFDIEGLLAWPLPRYTHNFSFTNFHRRQVRFTVDNLLPVASASALAGWTVTVNRLPDRIYMNTHTEAEYISVDSVIQ